MHFAVFCPRFAAKDDCDEMIAYAQQHLPGTVPSAASAHTRESMEEVPLPCTP